MLVPDENSKQIDPGFSWKTTSLSPPFAHPVHKYANDNYSQAEAMRTPALQLWIASIRGLVCRPVEKYVGTKVRIDDELHGIATTRLAEHENEITDLVLDSCRGPGDEEKRSFTLLTISLVSSGGLITD
ncbi:uncharacterized protein NECHADRAFT_82238 [Fusarium vanettenii 77-13-4]|uniref:Uncharacterized protein n=1 Tax=Fusarium vanettenii (strain ATCC MYA-4622 / CBS 123669 / FGSC 9596 / NRRL 45880 / 77-13-4) TaxID=660122 RepID=C7ZPS5_FUSV7|nr:uncharacterized protein NECHADRAFT_82238 [Fusarium vanettenii 77-13-4]EEU33973.1 predicted protein [Fusarium vanettenii 77-13-4]